MRAVVTRVRSASVQIEDLPARAIGHGLLVLIGAEDGDGEQDIRYIVDKVVGLRIFEDSDGKMNRSVTDVDGALLVVSQFTLLGDARKGRRPSFIRSGDIARAQELYNMAVARFQEMGVPTKTGEFQAHMLVASENDGPVTILLDSRKTF